MLAMDRTAGPAKGDGTRRSVLGMVAGAYLAWFVGAGYGGALGLIAGLAAGGLEGAYAGVILGVAVGSAVCLFGGRLRGRVLGGVFIGTVAATAGLALGLSASVGGGALSGLVPPLLGAGRLDFDGSPRNQGALRWAVWVAVGAVAGAIGMGVLDGFRGMDL